MTGFWSRLRSRCVNQRQKKLKSTGNHATGHGRSLWRPKSTKIPFHKCSTEWPWSLLFPVPQSGTGDSLDSRVIWVRFIRRPSRCAKSIWWWCIIWKMCLHKLSFDCFILIKWKSRFGLAGIPEWKEHESVNFRWTNRNYGTKQTPKNSVPLMVVPVAHALNDWRVTSTSE